MPLLPAILAGCALLSPYSRVEPPNLPGTDHPSTPLAWRADPDCVAGLRPYREVAGSTRGQRATDCRRRTGQASIASPPARDLIALSISGGGTKASAFAGESMFVLDAMGLLPRASMISSVSGGSFAAAYYALSCTPDEDPSCDAPTARGVTRPVWDYRTAMPVLQSGFEPMLWRAGFDALVPGVKTPVAIETFAHFIDGRYLRRRGSQGPAARFADLNPRRPLLVLNSTLLSGSRSLAETTQGRGFLRRRTADEFLHFAFTDYYFGRIGSDLESLPLGYAVASSSAFPALIGYSALRNYRCNEDGLAGPDCADQPTTMLTLTDGGANDNQGLVEVFDTIAELADGQQRSDLSQAGHVSPALERMQPGDHALLLVINSSLTEATGIDRPGDRDYLLGTISRASAAVDAYSAVAYNLRRQLYVGEAAQLQARRGDLSIRPVEIGLATLNRYAAGGQEVDTLAQAGVRELRALRAIRDTQGRQRAVFDYVSQPPMRAALRLGHVHPQCLFEQSKLVEKSVIGLAHLSDAAATCLRHAARWSTVLSIEALCQAGKTLAEPGAMPCRAGHAVLTRPDRLGPLGECDLGADDAEDVRTILRSLRRNPGFMQDAGPHAPTGEGATAVRNLCDLERR